MAVTVVRRPRSARLAAVLAAVLLAAGCSGSPEEESSSPAAQGTSAEEPAAFVRAVLKQPELVGRFS